MPGSEKSPAPGKFSPPHESMRLGFALVDWKINWFVPSWQASSVGVPGQVDQAYDALTRIDEGRRQKIVAARSEWWSAGDLSSS
jgi:hypothetical protein